VPGKDDVKTIDNYWSSIHTEVNNLQDSMKDCHLLDN